MSLAVELLEQARHLAVRESRRPRQASLRRAVSAAYYALFHLLVTESTKLVLRGTRIAELEPRIARSFDHSEMKQVSRAFKMSQDSPRLPAGVESLPETPGDRLDLRFVASTFVKLQEKRHQADYDTAIHFDRIDVVELINSTAETFRAWRRIRKTPLAQAYLLALLVSRRWSRD